VRGNARGPGAEDGRGDRRLAFPAVLA
jgi:hypothetical protein